VTEHDVVLYGPCHDDGMVTDVSDLKTSVKDLKDTIKKTMWSLGVPLVIFCFSFLWGLLTHSITLVMGH
jgi:hypothetical protein